MIQRLLEQQRTADFSAGYMEALHDVEASMIELARERDAAYSRGYDEGRSGGALVPFFFLALGALVGFVLGLALG